MDGRADPQSEISRLRNTQNQKCKWPLRARWREGRRQVDAEQIENGPKLVKNVSKMVQNGRTRGPKWAKMTTLGPPRGP